MNKETQHQDLIAENSELRYKVHKLEHELAQIKRVLFGAKSERYIPSLPGQLSLEIQQTETVESKEETVVVDAHERKKKKKEKPPVRQVFPDSLPREVITIYPEGYDENTSETPVGKEVTEILEEVPGKIYVKRYERLKFAQPDQKSIAIGPLPSRPIEKGLFGEHLLTRIIIDKYCDHLPLYRQQQRFQRAGVKLAYSTLADVPAQIAKLLSPLYNELKNQTLSSSYIQADETPHPVLDKDVKEKAHRGYLWVYHSPEQRLVLFDYRKGRGREGPRQLLKDFKGYLQTDGYGVYDEFELKREITLVGCMAHARRYFEKALENDRDLASFFMDRIQQVYATERKIREEHLNDDQIISLRKESAAPILDELFLWMKENIVHTTPQSPIGKAMHYALPRWKRLTEYLNNPILNIDNNLVENAIRPTVLGRKNYLFSGSHEGAERSAMFYSFIGSCKMNGINPEEWLVDVLLKIPDTKLSDLNTLLPNNWNPGR